MTTKVVKGFRGFFNHVYNESPSSEPKHYMGDFFICHPKLLTALALMLQWIPHIIRQKDPNVVLIQSPRITPPCPVHRITQNMEIHYYEKNFHE